jgi:predicted glycogen debranching enzyme
MNLPTITLQKDAVNRFSEVIEKEWLITNGLGGYASSSVLGINTRKYHGLLVAALHPPGDRTVCLAKLDEDVTGGNMVFRLGANEFKDSIYPQGYKFLKQFSISPYPTFLYNVDKVEVAKTVFMPKNLNAVSIIYNIKNSGFSDVKIRIFPLLTCRYYHTVVDQHRNPLKFTQKSGVKEYEATFQNPQATIVCRATDGIFLEKMNWVEQLHYRDEEFRGETSFDDCFQPGSFEMQIPAESTKEFAISVAASPERQAAREIFDSLGNSIQEVKATYNTALNQNIQFLSDFYGDHPAVPVNDWLNWILLAADSFMVQDNSGKKSVIAGYHWFEPWGRDTFISLPGLMLVTGRYEDAKGILQHFIQYCQGGLIPNFVTDKTGEPVYNTVDGTLWYVNAVLQYVKYTGDLGFVQSELWENLQTIVDYHQKGTLFGIHLDDDGLLMHDSRLTWMDAVVDGDEITPRMGKAVEIQALWYNTLRTMEFLAGKFGEKNLAQKYNAMANQTKLSFNEKFWNTQKSCLYDVLEAKTADASLRPNQIFAVSLDFSMLDAEKRRSVVELVAREHVTPYGLRTLSLDDPKFVGKCTGNRRSRDTAYHNGTIWPWLLGPYVTAYLKVNSYSLQARAFALENLVLPLFTVGINQGGLGTINEIYDCDPPNAPRGCIAQAWSVGEPLRAYIEDVLGIKPKFSP